MLNCLVSFHKYGYYLSDLAIRVHWRDIDVVSLCCGVRGLMVAWTVCVLLLLMNMKVIGACNQHVSVSPIHVARRSRHLYMTLLQPNMDII